VPALALWGSGASTPVYPIYRTDWGLSQVEATTVFAVYPLALALVLACFGGVSDRVGRRAAMLAGVVSIAAGALVFGVAPDLGLVIVGRALMGVGVGLGLSPATAVMVAFASHAPPGRSSSIATASTAIGLAFATFIGGALVEYAPAPLHFSYWVLFAVAVVVLLMLLRLPPDRPARIPSEQKKDGRLPAESRGVLVRASISIAAAYSLGALELSLGADIGKTLVGTSNAFVIGSVISLTSLVIGVVALAARRLSARISGAFGGIASVAATATLIGAAQAFSLLLFVGFALLGGIAYSLLFASGIAALASSIPESFRATSLSTAYLVGCVIQVAVALSLGVVATTWGLLEGVSAGLPVVGGIGAIALITNVLPPVRRDHRR
jgi:predicted MFS family arabinose efflux permease